MLSYLADRVRERPAILPLLATAAILIGVGAGPAPAEGAWTGLPPAGLLRWAVASIVAVLALVGLVLLVSLRGLAPGESPPRRRSLLSGLLMPLLLAAALALLSRHELADLDAPEEPTPAAGEQSRASSPDGVEPGLEVGEATALAVIVVASLLILWLLRRQGPGTEEPERATGQDPDPLGAAVARAARLLLDPTDPRAAVLLAYRELEVTLEGLDLPRHRSETPTEHLGRALRHLSIDDPEEASPLLELAALYARARYSDHPIDAADRRRAALALERADRRLAGAR